MSDYPTGTGVFGTIRTDAIADPAVGTEYAIPLVLRTRRRIHSFSALLTCSVVVANRIPNLTVTYNTIAPIQSSANILPLVALSVTTVIFTSAGAPAAAGPGTLVIPLPQPMDIGPLSSIETVVTGLDAGDQWTIGLLTYEERLEP